MRFDGKKNKQKALSLKLEKLSSVSSPAQEDAIVTVIKKKADDKAVKMMFQEVLSEMQLDDKLEEVMDEMYDYNSSLTRSLYSIANDPEINNKKEAFQETMFQYLNQCGKLLEDAKLFKFKDVEGSLPEGDIKLVKGVLTTLGIKTKETDMKPEEVQKMIDEKVSEVSADRDMYKTLASFNDETKKYYNGLKEDEKADFLKKSEDERKEAVAISKSLDEVVEHNGVSIKKSEDPKAFEILKMMKKEREADQAKIEKLEKAQARKEAEDIVKSKYSSLLGTEDELVTAYMAIQKMDPAERDAIMKTWDQKVAGVDEMFKTKGHGLEDNSDEIQKSKTDLKKEIDKKYNKKGAK